MSAGKLTVPCRTVILTSLVRVEEQNQMSAFLILEQNLKENWSLSLHIRWVLWLCVKLFLRSDPEPADLQHHHTHTHTHTHSLAVTQNAARASIMTGGHFEAAPLYRSETSCLWRAVSLLTLTLMIFMTLELIGNQVSAPRAAALLTICI